MVSIPIVLYAQHPTNHDTEDGILVPGDWNPYPYVWPDLMTQPMTALNDRVYPPVCARLVGGGSTINAMNWIRYVVVIIV